MPSETPEPTLRERAWRWFEDRRHSILTPHMQAAAFAEAEAAPLREEIERLKGAKTRESLIATDWAVAASDWRKCAETAEAKAHTLEKQLSEERLKGEACTLDWAEKLDAALAAASRAREEQGALRAALEGLRYPFDPMEPDAPPRFCGHAAEPCDRCAAARRALAPPAAESQENQQQLTGKGAK